ncbi:ABC transporter substrate-binding protein [Xanthobacter sp. VNH20]|uniref:ABC transporter substrate-binding protein n=1 Tax=Xanthobacter sp. VNH20 TaxID=3156616 RepID=UPI0032B57CE6
MLYFSCLSSRSRTIVGALALSLSLLTGAAQAASLHVGIQDDPDALDPATNGTYAGRFVLSALCDKLVDISPDLKIVPQLAESWEWAPDGKSITFSLRKSVTFQDGTPLDAEAVKFNFDRMKTMPDSKRKAEITPVLGAEVISPEKVRLTLSDPFVPLLSVLTDRAGMMVSPKAAKEKGENFGAAPVCAGPYEFVERKSRDLIRVKKFDKYWNAPAIGYDEIVYDYVLDSSVRLARLRAGDLDIMERVAPNDLKSVRENADLALYSAPGLAVSHLAMNLNNGEGSKALFNQDPRLREALELSIDRTVINKVAFNGEFVAGNQMMPPSSPFYDKARPIPARDLAKAKELMAAAGHPKVPIEITYGNALSDGRVAQILQSMISQAGFEVKLLPLESATATQRFLSGNYQAYIGNWSGRPDPDPTLVSFFACDGSQNTGKYCDKAFDALLTEARGEADEAKRKQLYDKATEMYLAARPTLPLYHPNWFFAARKGVDGIVMYPDGLLRVTGLKPKN